jgi:hypothetical protein
VHADRRSGNDQRRAQEPLDFLFQQHSRLLIPSPQTAEVTGEMAVRDKGGERGLIDRRGTVAGHGDGASKRVHEVRGHHEES